MKSHFIVKFLPGAVHTAPPAWIDVIEHGARPPAEIGHGIDELLRRHHLSVRVTREYKARAGGRFAPDEAALGLDRVYRFILAEEADIPEAFIEEACRLHGVEYIRRGAVSAAPIPAPVRAQTVGGLNHEASRSRIFLRQAQRYSEGDPSITVAVLDTGIDTGHPELQGTLAPGYDFVDIIQGATEFIGDFLGTDAEPADEVGHGTHVSGIIAGRGLNMPRGAVPRCRIMPVRVLGAMQSGGKKVGAGLVDNINAGIKWAVDNGADVINMSLGVKHAGGGLPHDEVIRYALAKGVTVVAASGNDGAPEKYYPGALPGVIAVGALNEEDEVAGFSSYGAHVTVAAPGTDILSAFVPEGYAICSGTSQAAPLVSGAVALLKSYAAGRGKRLHDRHVKYLLKHTADKLDTRFKDPRWGYGRVNVLDAVKLLDHLWHSLN